ncbi:MAG: efflux transporter outer membrane subunit [Desulfovibrionaceae bacterium]|nr:efflux transporter outer membrane subunit [Desulfovibrionaceae bacterium]
MNNLGRASLCLLLALSLGACSLAPRYERPQQDLPPQWKQVQAAPAPLESTWWERFNDPVLTMLVQDALKHNMELETSLANVEAAAAKLGMANAALLPSLSGTALNQQAASSERTPGAVRTGLDPIDRGHYTNQGQLTASWELDLWGKRRNQSTMLTDMLISSAIGHQASRLELAGQTAQAYFSLRALDMQLDTARRTLKTREDGLKIYESRYRAGEMTQLDLMRVRAEVESARQQMHTTLVAVEQAEAALAVLVGRSPREIMESSIVRGKGLAALPAVPVLPAGLPSDLLRRRPDIQAAEYLIMAYNANIGVARAEFFPTISLTGMLGTASSALASLFTGPAAMWSKGVSASLPIFDGGYNWNNLKSAEAQKKAAVAAYRLTVQKAFRDIRSALAAQREADAIVASNERQVASLRRAAEVARLQYSNGYTDYLSVLDAERQLFSAELSLATAMSSRLSGIVDVCMALGGGWESREFSAGFPLVNQEKLLRDVETARPDSK